MTVVLQTDM